MGKAQERAMPHNEQEFEENVNWQVTHKAIVEEQNARPFPEGEGLRAPAHGWA